MTPNSVKDEVLFLISIRKKMDVLNTNKTNVDKVFKQIVEDLRRQYQISEAATELIDAMYDLAKYITEPTVKTVEKIVHVRDSGGDGCGRGTGGRSC